MGSQEHEQINNGVQCANGNREAVEATFDEEEDIVRLRVEANESELLSDQNDTVSSESDNDSDEEIMLHSSQGSQNNNAT